LSQSKAKAATASEGRLFFGYFLLAVQKKVTAQRQLSGCFLWLLSFGRSKESNKPSGD